MLKLVLLIFTILLSAPVAWAQRNSPASKAELAEITERGRQLAEYDIAAWHATDAVLALKPAEGSIARYIAKKTDNKWTVVFGRFNERRDRFLIVYQANQGANSKEFKVKKFDVPEENAGYYLYAAKAIETALADFRGEKRPYNIAVLPAASNQMYVYVLPAQTKQNIYPLGGDVRYLISSDGSKIAERRQLHRAIIEFETSENIEAGFHVAVLDDIPEDTDVFHVLSRKPSVPQWIATSKYVYRIEPDGSINYVMTKEAFMKIREKQ